MMTLVGNEKESYDALRANKKKYENLDKFLKEIWENRVLGEGELRIENLYFVYATYK